MKIAKLLIIAAILPMFGCNTGKQMEIKDACSQSNGTRVILQGYLSLPKTIDTITLKQGSNVMALGNQIFLMTKTDATGDAVKVTIWTTTNKERNKMKPLPSGYSWNDLVVYTDKGDEVKAGKLLKLTGDVRPDEKTGCEVRVTKIETP
ncbi:MAG: hypothetical protein R2682_00865 [Pyrinomonadaceae bacterium]